MERGHRFLDTSTAPCPSRVPLELHVHARASADEEFATRQAGNSGRASWGVREDLDASWGENVSCVLLAHLFGSALVRQTHLEDTHRSQRWGRAADDARARESPKPDDALRVNRVREAESHHDI